jgi:hypothetical protein
MSKSYCKELVRFVTPSRHRGRISSWDMIERELGSELPADYKEFIIKFGAADLGAFIYPLSPFSTQQSRNLLSQIPRQLSALRELKEAFTWEIPLPLYPETNGVLPWGITANGDVLHWLTIGHPSEWTTVVTASRDSAFRIYPFGMCRFLFGIMSKEIICDIFPADFPVS